MGRRLRLGLPAGVLPLSLGTVASGASAYGFLIVSARVLGPGRDGSLSALWSLAFLLGPGCFSPLEREVSREIAARLTRGLGSRPAARKSAEIGAALVCLLIVMAVGTAPYLVTRVFDHQVLLMVSLIMALVGYYTMHLTWGILAGCGHFSGYSAVTASEGVVRLIVCLGLAGYGVRSAGPYGLAIGCAPFAAALVGWQVQRPRLADGPPMATRRTIRAIVFLLASSVLSQFVLLGGPLAVKVLSGPGDRAEAGRFLAGMTLVRIPLFLFNAVMAALLPHLTDSSHKGQRAAFANTLARLTCLVILLGLLSTSAAATVGPKLLRRLFGSGYALPGAELAGLSGAVCLYLSASLFSFGLIALEDHLWTTISWGCAAVVFLVTIGGLHGTSVTTRVETAFVASSVVAVATMVCFLLQRARRYPWDRQRIATRSSAISPSLTPWS